MLRLSSALFLSNFTKAINISHGYDSTIFINCFIFIGISRAYWKYFYLKAPDFVLLVFSKASYYGLLEIFIII